MFRLYEPFGAVPGITRFGRQEHFCSPFALPEEFTSVYRLHAMMPDYIDLFDAATGRPMAAGQAQQLGFDLSATQNKLSTKEVLREKSHRALRQGGIDNWVTTFGNHPCGQLTAHNFPKFLSDLPGFTPPVGKKVNLAAMDLLRDRERGGARFNDFREAIGLQRLTDFDDFVSKELQWEIANRQTTDQMAKRTLTDEEVEARKAVLQAQRDYVEKLKNVYASVDDVDLQVGILAEFVRPHGFVISETQFQIFILNASRRIFSDRFFNRSFNDEHYTKWGKRHVDEIFFIHSDELETLSLRPRGVIGAGDYTWLPRIISLRQANRLVQIGDGSTLADFTSVDNLVGAIATAIAAPKESYGRVYNITNGTPEKLWDVIEMALKLVDLDAKRKVVPLPVMMAVAKLSETVGILLRRPSEPLILPIKIGVAAYSLTMDISAIQQHLQYRPQVTTAAALRQFAEWWKANNSGKGR